MCMPLLCEKLNAYLEIFVNKKEARTGPIARGVRGGESSKLLMLSPAQRTVVSVPQHWHCPPQEGGVAAYRSRMHAVGPPRASHRQ